jgi:hypothetical protein
VFRVKLLWLATFAALAWSEVPNCRLAPGWEQSGPRRSYEGESLYEYMNGNSEGYLIYGFRKMTGVTCTNGTGKILVDVSDMGDPESAFGIFSANRDVRQPAEPIGMGGQIVPRKAIAAKGQYYLEIAAEPEGDYRDLLRTMMRALAGQVQGQSTPPDALGWFPREGMKEGFPRLIPQSVLGIRVLKRGYVAEYGNGAKAFVVPAASVEEASSTLEKLQARLAEPAALQAGEAGVVGKDKYLGTMAIFRKGRYVAGYSGVAEGTDAPALANGLAANVR